MTDDRHHQQAVDQTMQQRAKELARPLERDTTPAASLEVLEFLLGGERYALETRYIREVQPLAGLTPLPGVPPFLLGIVYLRGQILGVVDLRRFFDLEAQGLSNLNRVLVVEHEGLEVGLLADEIVGVGQLPEERLTDNLATLDDERRAYIRGITPEHLVLLDLPRLASDPRLTLDDSPAT